MATTHPGPDGEKDPRNPALARQAATGIYRLRGVPRSVHTTARARAVSEGTTLRRVLLQGLHEYAAGTWTPGPAAKESK
jgi:hypothetical protein